jgi:hypothetical protein
MLFYIYAVTFHYIFTTYCNKSSDICLGFQKRLLPRLCRPLSAPEIVWRPRSTEFYRFKNRDKSKAELSYYSIKRYTLSSNRLTSISTLEILYA